MLNLHKVKNIDFTELKKSRFDLGIFASGYEFRSIYIAQNFSKNQFSANLVLGFEEKQGLHSRKNNDIFYDSNYSKPYIISAINAEKDIYNVLNIVFNNFKSKSKIRILIDYTSMSRIWYAAILNYILYKDNVEIDVYICYALREYSDTRNITYSAINVLPSLEGSLSNNIRTLLILSTGTNSDLARSIIDEIEPNDIIGILPIPGLIPEFERKSIKVSESLNDLITTWVNCPINNLEYIFRIYAEITSLNVNERDILFLSLGPKIFTIASILVSQRFDQATCLYLKSKIEGDITQASGIVVCNKIVYK